MIQWLDICDHSGFSLYLAIGIVSVIEVLFYVCVMTVTRNGNHDALLIEFPL